MTDEAARMQTTVSSPAASDAADRGGAPARVHVSRDGAIATVVIDSPARRNALSVEIALGLQDAMAELDADPEVRCVIVRGAGGRAFSAGADISEFSTWRVNKRRGRIYAGILGAALESVRACRHPTIALIEGDCVGGGLGVAVMCDLRVCGASSRFGVPVKRLGLVESPDELAPLVAKLGANPMLEILLLGEVFGAEDALRLGLVNRAVPDDEVEATAHRMAASVAEGAPLSARWHKKFIHRLLDPRPLTDEERDEGYDCYDTEDFQIGFRAFLAKERPKFTGK
ncbi:MAG: enoyl-CoA hydratase-related protein [Immundisolibacterales bacterium]|nr:enoyl-CoA hydratase-related protein [Immundisolibacterales bacterium]